MTEPSQDPTPTGLSRWRLLGRSVVLLVILAALARVAPNVPWRTIGVLVIGAGVVATAPAIWSARGERLSDWGAGPATPEFVRSVFTGAAVVFFGMTFIAISLFDLNGAPWVAAAVAGATTLVPLYGAVGFLALASRARTEEKTTAARQSSRLLSAALALAADDPDVGPIELRKGWSGSVATVRQHGTERELTLTSAAGRVAALRRFAAGRMRPEAYPSSIAFLEEHTVWATTSQPASAAVWIRPPDPAAVAATAVSDSVQHGWQLDSSVNSAGMFGYAAMKAVVLTKPGVRRAISIVSGHVTLLDHPIELDAANP